MKANYIPAALVIVTLFTCQASAGDLGGATAAGRVAGQETGAAQNAAERVRQNYLYKLTLASLMVYAMIAGCLARKSPHKFGGSIWRCGRKWMNACGDNGRLPRQCIWVGVV